jgi:hypothetical protein
MLEAKKMPPKLADWEAATDHTNKEISETFVDGDVKIFKLKNVKSSLPIT